MSYFITDAAGNFIVNNLRYVITKTGNAYPVDNAGNVIASRICNRDNRPLLTFTHAMSLLKIFYNGDYTELTAPAIDQSSQPATDWMFTEPTSPQANAVTTLQFRLRYAKIEIYNSFTQDHYCNFYRTYEQLIIEKHFFQQV